MIRFHKKRIVGYVVTSVTISKVRPLFMKLFRHFVSWIRQLSRFVKHFRPQHPVFTDFVSQKKFFRLCRYICNHISGKTVFHETYTPRSTARYLARNLRLETSAMPAARVSRLPSRYIHFVPGPPDAGSSAPGLFQMRICQVSSPWAVIFVTTDGWFACIAVTVLSAASLVPAVTYILIALSAL